MPSSIPFIIILCFILIFPVWLSVYDIKTLSVPLWCVLLATVGLLAARIFFYTSTFYLYIISSAVLTLIYFLIKIITHSKLGTGDILFGLFQGLGFRPQFIWICLTVEVVAGLIFFLIKRGTKKMPFIPFMASGLLVSFIIDAATTAAIA